MGKSDCIESLEKSTDVSIDKYVNLDENFILYLSTERAQSEKEPGNYILDSFDRDHLELIDTAWIRNVRGLGPALVLKFNAKKKGLTRVTGSVQLDRINPLFIEITYDVYIN